MRALVYLIHAGLWSSLGALAALYLTGQLTVPSLPRPGEDDDLVRWSELFRQRTQPARVIYLHRGPITLQAGVDAAHENRSSVVFSSGIQQATMPGWNGTNKAWTSLVDCVKKQFEPFAVEVTDVRPQRQGYAMVVVGGRPSDLSVAKKNVTGLAPFNGTVIPDPVVFAFSASLKNRARQVCETIAMEVAHAYGLDHGFHCPDVMSYLSNCGNKSFVDKDVPCGEGKARVCAGGKPTQNSYRALVAILGPRGQPTAEQPPGVSPGPPRPVGHEHDHAH